MTELEVGDIVLCTVERIEKAIVFVRIEGNGRGSIILSEIAPGRIRNLRDYVTPGKKIACKILNIKEDRIYLSLRRVKQSEKKELLERVSKEKSFKAMLKTVLGKEKSVEVVDKIEEDYGIFDFFEQIKKDFKLLDKYFSKIETEKMIKILESKKDKLKEITKRFVLSNRDSDGVVRVKDILISSCKGSKCEVGYVAAGKYRLNISGEDFKEIKTEVGKVMMDIEKQARKKNCEFEMLK